MAYETFITNLEFMDELETVLSGLLLIDGIVVDLLRLFDLLATGMDRAGVVRLKFTVKIPYVQKM
jgi:hypothetical protein